MKAFVHPHVMGILGICLAGQAPYIVMPFMANGSLHSYLRKHRAELLISEDEDIDLVQEIVACQGPRAISNKQVLIAMQ